MAQRVIFYRNANEKKQKIQEQEAMGFRVLHDDFIDEAGKGTKKGRGRLTMTNDQDMARSLQEMTQAEFVALLAARHGVKIRGALRRAMDSMFNRFNNG